MLAATPKSGSELFSLLNSRQEGKIKLQYFNSEGKADRIPLGTSVKLVLRVEILPVTTISGKKAFEGPETPFLTTSSQVPIKSWPPRKQKNVFRTISQRNLTKIKFVGRKIYNFRNNAINFC